MNKAINREAIAQAFLGGSQVRIGGESIYGFDPTLDEAIWPGLINPKWAEDWDEAYGYDPVAAKQLLVDAGYPEGFEYHPLPVHPGRSARDGGHRSGNGSGLCGDWHNGQPG